MTSFLALYHGETIGSAGLVATTADPDMVRDFAERLLSTPVGDEPDAVLRELALGQRRALRLMRDESEG